MDECPLSLQRALPLNCYKTKAGKGQQKRGQDGAGALVGAGREHGQVSWTRACRPSQGGKGRIQGAGGVSVALV